MTLPEMKIYIAHNPTDAHLLCELLKQAHIQCEVRGEGLFGLRGELPLSEDTEPYIWLLDEAQHAKAQAIIADYQRPLSAQDTQPWRCTYCGEVNEGQFAICWQCGHIDDPAE